MICPSCSVDNEESSDNCIRCGKGLYALTIGTVLSGRYEILGALGRGGMGIVYKATDRELEETVAIKTLRADVAGSADVAKRFRGEIKLARKVSHPNVCRIHEYGKEGPLAYIVMEFIEGIDLKRVIRDRGPLPPEDAYEVAIQVADALQAIQSVGIVHRDLKTPNIMRDAQGVVKLMDFGIAKRFDAESTTGVTGIGQIVGTPEYMSPEQARAERIDARSDIYALGIVVFELFTGEVPFRGETPLATLFMHVQDPVTLEGPRAARIPPALVPVLRRALAKDKDERFASARAMAEALREARAGVPRFARAEAPAPFFSAEAPQLRPFEETTPMPAATLATPSRVPPATRSAPHAATVAEPGRIRSTARSAATEWPRLHGPEPRRSRAGVWASGLALSGIVAMLGVAALYLGRGKAPAESAATVASTVPTSAATVTPTAPSPSPAVIMEERTAEPASTAAPEPERARGRAEVARVAVREPPSPSRVGAVRVESKELIAWSSTAPAVPTAAPSASTPLPATVPPSTPVVATAPAATAAPITAVPTPEPAAAFGVDDARARVQIAVRPWAEVTLDEKVVGITPMTPLSVGAGSHSLRFVHPDYQPISRKVTVRRGETIRVQIDFGLVGVPKK